MANLLNGIVGYLVKNCGSEITDKIKDFICVNSNIESKKEYTPKFDSLNDEVLVKAMINAAKADGKIEDEELNNIYEIFNIDGAKNEKTKWLIDELNKPIDIDSLVDLIGNDKDLAINCYSASLYIIAPKIDKEDKAYLDILARKLHLDEKTVKLIKNNIL